MSRSPARTVELRDAQRLRAGVLLDESGDLEQRQRSPSRPRRPSGAREHADRTPRPDRPTRPSACCAPAAGPVVVGAARHDADRTPSAIRPNRSTIVRIVVIGMKHLDGGEAVVRELADEAVAAAVCRDARTTASPPARPMSATTSAGVAPGACDERRPSVGEVPIEGVRRCRARGPAVDERLRERAAGRATGPELVRRLSDRRRPIDRHAERGEPLEHLDSRRRRSARWAREKPGQRRHARDRGSSRARGRRGRRRRR